MTDAVGPDSDLGRAGILATANATTSLISAFAGFLVVAAWLGSAQVGLLALVGAAVFPLRFADLGVGGSTSRFVAAYSGPDPGGFARRIAAVSTATTLTAFAILAAVCLIVSPVLLAQTIPSDQLKEARQLSGIVALTALAQLLAGTINAVLIGQRRFARAYWAGIVASVVQLTVLLPLICAMGIGGFVVAQACGYLVVLANGLLAIGQLPRAAAAEQSDFTLASFLGFTGQFTLYGLAATLLDPTAKLILGSTTSLRVVGCYEIIWRSLVQLRTVAAAALEPVGYRLIALSQTERNRADRYYARLFVTSWAVAVALAAAAPVIYSAIAVVIPTIAVDQGWLLALMVGMLFGLGFCTIPAHYRALADGRLWPMLAAVLCNIVTQLSLFFILPHGRTWLSAMVAILAGYVISVIVFYAATWQMTKQDIVPSSDLIRDHLMDLRNWCRTSWRRLRSSR